MGIICNPINQDNNLKHQKLENKEGMLIKNKSIE